MGTYFAPSSLFTQALGVIHRGKVCIQSTPLKRYQNVKTSIATSKAQSQYLSIITSEQFDKSCSCSFYICSLRESINPLRAKDVYIRPGCTLLSAELISFWRPRTYIYVLKVFRIRPRVLHSVGQGRIYTSSIYAARRQRRIYTSFLHSFLKTFGLKNVKEIHFQIILKIMPQRINAFGSDKIQKARANFLFQNGFCNKHIESQISHS